MEEKLTQTEMKMHEVETEKELYFAKLSRLDQFIGEALRGEN